jgi:hypothetical protein
MIATNYTFQRVRLHQPSQPMIQPSLQSLGILLRIRCLCPYFLCFFVFVLVLSSCFCFCFLLVFLFFLFSYLFWAIFLLYVGYPVLLYSTHPYAGLALRLLSRALAASPVLFHYCRRFLLSRIWDDPARLGQSASACSIIAFWF